MSVRGGRVVIQASVNALSRGDLNPRFPQGSTAAYTNIIHTSWQAVKPNGLSQPNQFNKNQVLKTR